MKRRRKASINDKIMLIFVMIVLTFGTSYMSYASTEPEVIRTRNGHYLG